MSLRTKLFLFFVATTLPLCWLAILALSIISRETLLSQTATKLESLASLQKQRINETLEHYFEESEFIASDQLASALQIYRNAPTADSARLLITTLNDLRNVFADARAIAVYDERQNFVTSTNGFVYKSSSTSSYDATQLIDLFFDQTNSLVLRLTSPLLKNGVRVGRAEIILSADALVKITEDFTGLGTTGEVELAQRNSQGDAVFITPLRFVADSALKRAVPHETPNSPIIEALRGKERSFTDKQTRDYRGIQTVAVSRYIEAEGWGLVAKIDRSEALEPIYRLRKNLLVIGILFYGLSLGIWILVSGIIVIPVRDLIRTVKRITKGDLSMRAPIHSQDEIGQLATTFNVMTDNIQESRAHLEQNVTERTVELQEKISQLEDAQGAAFNLLEDLQEEKRKIEAEDARDEAILTSIGDGMLTTDAKGKIVIMNRRAEELLGVSAQKARGKLITTIWRIADAKGHHVSTEHHPAQRVLKSGTPLERSDWHYLDKHHKLVPAAMTVAPVALNNKLIGMIAVFRDITHEKEVDRAKTEFVSLASHQLRTPLSAINWYTEMLLDGDAGKVNKEQRHYLEEIYHGNKRMVDLVNALLNTSRIDLGTFAVDPKLTNVVDISKTVLLELKPQILERKLELVETYSSEIPAMKADPKLLKIILQNLLSNAVKYTPEGGKVSLTIDVTYHTVFHNLGKQKDGIIATISDTGYGIPKTQQNKIFTKLFRADNVREKDTEGTGLGLYIVKSIVEQSGGKIWFESEENKGTTFYVQLPLIGMKKKAGAKALT